jgi:hypothetical protein
VLPSEVRPKPSPSFNASDAKTRQHVQPLVNPRQSEMDESYASAALLDRWEAMTNLSCAPTGSLARLEERSSTR